MKIIIPVLASLCLSTACTHPVTSKIQVTGEATMKVVPDMVELSLKSFNVRPAMKDAVKETQAAINQILTVCHKYIRVEEDIKVSNVATNKEYDYTGNREVFKGYSAQQILEVRLKDIRQLQPFTEAEKMCQQMDVRLGKVIYLSNYSPGGERTSSIQPGGNDYELNLYNKSFGGRGFKMSSEILEFRDAAFAGFKINQ
jgi:hypothetical protein